MLVAAITSAHHCHGVNQSSESTRDFPLIQFTSIFVFFEFWIARAVEQLPPKQPFGLQSVLHVPLFKIYRVETWSACNYFLWLGSHFSHVWVSCDITVALLCICNCSMTARNHADATLIQSIHVFIGFIIRHMHVVSPNEPNTWQRIEWSQSYKRQE